MQKRIDEIRDEERKKNKNRRPLNSNLSVPKDMHEESEEELSRT